MDIHRPLTGESAINCIQDILHHRNGGRLHIGNGESIIFQIAAMDRAENVKISDITTYDIAKPGIAFRNVLIEAVYTDLPGTTIPVTFDQKALNQNGSQGVLLLHHHNATGQRGGYQAWRCQSAGTENFCPIHSSLARQVYLEPTR